MRSLSLCAWVTIARCIPPYRPTRAKFQARCSREREPMRLLPAATTQDPRDPPLSHRKRCHRAGRRHHLRQSLKAQRHPPQLWTLLKLIWPCLQGFGPGAACCLSVGATHNGGLLRSVSPRAAFFLTNQQEAPRYAAEKGESVR